MKLGAERKKVALLGGLVLFCGYLFYTNVLSDSGGTQAPSTSPRRTKLPDPAAALITPEAPKGELRRAPARINEEFHPSLKPKKPGEMPDPMTIDPKIRLDLLAKVQAVEVAGGARNLFTFSAPPPPPTPKAPPVVPKTPAEIAKEQAAAAKVEPPKPAGPPPLNLSWKYFGYTSVRGDARKKAFFLDGEDVLAATEGEVLKRRYRVVRIGVNSVVMEDTETKSQQTLPLLEEANT